jgi:hypothetical protein
VALASEDFEPVTKSGALAFGVIDLAAADVSYAAMRGVMDVRPFIDQSLIENVISALTTWKPMPPPEAKDIQTFAVSGVDYADAIDKFNRLFLDNNWGDGLPLVPPTLNRVQWLLTGSDRSPDQKIGKIPPRMGVSTARQIAVNAAMAGARPEYMPVIIAALEAMLRPEFKLQSMLTTTNPVSPVMIINGPIRKQLPINSGFSLFGPSAKYPAGAIIGHAVRLTLQNVGGLIPGVTAMSQYAQPGRFGVGLCFCEAEDKSPWEPLHVERGFNPKSNTVTVFGVQNIVNVTSFVPETDAKLIEHMTVPNALYWYLSPGAAGIMVVGPGLANLYKAKGWSKQDLQKYLWQEARIPYDKMVKFGRSEDLSAETIKLYAQWAFDDLTGKKPVRIAEKPTDILIVVSGGVPDAHVPWLSAGVGGRAVQTQEIQLPSNWGKLMETAKKEGWFWSP